MLYMSVYFCHWVLCGHYTSSVTVITQRNRWSFSLALFQRKGYAKPALVPDAMKLARVIPIHKSKSKQEFNNYRPISLLSSISKVLEKVVHNRLYSFLTKHNLLYCRQYGFRPKRSTIDAITEFTADVLPSLDSKKNVYLFIWTCPRCSTQ